MTNKDKYNKLINIRNDITNDADEIGTINRRLEEIISEYKKFSPICNGEVAGRVSGLKEAYQTNDGNLVQAKNCIQAEINSVEKDIKAEEALKAGVK